MVDAFVLAVVLLVSAALAIGAARAILGVVLEVMAFTAVRSLAGSAPARMTVGSAGRLTVGQHHVAGFDAAAPLVVQEAA
jgi:hypothetical protein